MELIKNSVHMNRLKSHIVTQITLDDDFNVPDINEDIYKVITGSATITNLVSRALPEKVSLSGSLDFKFLYDNAKGDGRIHHMSGSIPFIETINCDNLDEHDNINIKWDIDDLNIGIINTRKISVKALVSISVSCEDIYDIETAAMPEGDTDIYALTKDALITQLAACKKDILRLRESLEIPMGKPNISEIIWNSLCTKSINTKLDDEKIVVSGEFLLFLLYNSESENTPVQWFESTIPFSGAVDLAGCNTDMISDISVSISDSTLNIKSDSDGEPRVIDAEIILDLNIKAYHEQEVSFIVDAYSTKKDITPTYSTISYNTILTKNISKCKIADRLKLDSSKGQVLQLFHISPQAKIDDITIIKDALNVEGVVLAKVMYISSNDKNPIAITDEVIPFSHKVEAPGIMEDSLCFIRPSLEQINTNMTGTGEVEIKGDVILDCLIINNTTEKIISDIETTEFDSAWLDSRPGMVGYMVKKDDTLWSVCKQFHSTKEHIMNINELKNENLTPGELLLV